MHRLLTVALCFVSLSAFAQSSDPATVDHTTGNFHGCAATGDATATSQSDPYLNALKNRDVPPIETDYVTKTIAAIIADKPAGAVAAGKKRRDKWTAAQRTSLANKERQAIQVEGFLVKVQLEGQESCNCHVLGSVDHHLWLVTTEGETRETSMVVEISPRELEANQDWVQLAETAAANGTFVRIRGWRTWDQEHPEQLGKTRGTLWEIHPIHEIDIQDENGNWIPIGGAKAVF